MNQRSFNHTIDSITSISVSSICLPLANPISDAKVLTGRQKPMKEISILVVEVGTASGFSGLGFSYSKRAGGRGQFAHAVEVAPSILGENPSDIAMIWDQLCWAGASVGRSGLAVQSIGAFDVALWDLKAKRANLSLSRLLGSHRDSVRCYNTSGGFLNSPVEQVIENAAKSLEKGIAGIKLKVGQPDTKKDVYRIEKVREALGDDVPLMVDANQQWDRTTAQRMCRNFDSFGLEWVEEPLDCYDYEGHAALSRNFDAPIATGEMLTSVYEHSGLIKANGADVLMPDGPRVGGITPYLKIQAMAEQSKIMLAPHFAMELHIHLASTYYSEPWVEHFEWLEPLFNERLEVKDGKILVPQRLGIGLTLSEKAKSWVVQQQEFCL